MERKEDSNIGGNIIETITLTRGKVLLCVSMRQNSTTFQNIDIFVNFSIYLICRKNPFSNFYYSILHIY